MFHVTSQNLRHFLACLYLLILTACSGGDGGGGNQSIVYTIGGTVSGLSGTGLVLQNNATDNLLVTANGTFTFSKAIASGALYDVTVKTNPTGQACTVTNGSGTVASAAITSISVTCVTTAVTTYNVGGAVSGLTGAGLVLQNNASDDLAVSASGTFVFASGVADGNGYSVSIKTQPAGQLCAVTNGTGTVTGADVTTVAINCLTAYTIGGSVSGLAGTGLVLQNNGGDNLGIAANGTFSFSTALLDTSSYSVTVLSQPGSPNQTCTVSNAGGIVAGANVTNVTINCTTTQYTIGGTVQGLAGTGLVLQNNAGDNLAISANGSFTFVTAIDDGSSYNVTVQTQPGSPSQTCALTNASGTLSGANVTNVIVNCTTNNYTVGGTVSGLTGTGLVLQNNAGNDLNITVGGPFTFTAALPDTSSYSVSVKTQPAGQICSVTNGAGVLAGSNVSNVAVDCIAIPTYSVSGTLSGLSGTGLVLQNNLGDDLAISANGSFTFATAIQDGNTYSVSVKTQPGSPNQSCTVTNGTGLVAGGNVTTVSINCTTIKYTVGGSVTGLTGSGLVLQNNAGDDLAVSTNSSFVFATVLDDGSSYAVTVKTQPAGQFCSVASGTGTLAGANVSNVSVSCGAVPTYNISVNVSGLSGSVVLQNNATDDLTISTNGSSSFATTLTEGSSYAVSVLTQPTGQNCVVSNGSGTVPAADVTNINLTCTNLPTYSIGGNVSGLTGTGLVLQNNAGDDLPVSAVGAFIFATGLYDLSTYAVTVKTQPTAQFCSVTNGSGTLAGANVTNVAVSCGPIPTYNIGGSVSGLVGSGLVLQNNGVDDLLITADGVFNFATKIEEGSTYAVTVKTQPTSPEQTCIVVNGSGTVSGGDVTNVTVACESRSWGTATLFEADDRLNVNAYHSSIAMDPNGNAVNVWGMLESNATILFAKYFDSVSNSWKGASIISAGNIGYAENARIAMDANGNAIVVWRQTPDSSYSSARDIWVNRYDAVTGSWGTATLIENNTGGAGEPQIAMHSNGDAIVVWPQADDGTWRKSIWTNRYTAASGSWGTAQLLENDAVNTADYPDIAMDANGNAMVAWSNDSSGSPQNEHITARRYNAVTATWEAAQVIENFLSLAREVKVNMNASGDAVVAWKQWGTEKDIAANYFDAVSKTWGTATIIDTRAEEASVPVVAVDPAGNALVVWDQSDGTAVSIWSNRYDAASSSWGTAATLEHVDVAAGVAPKIAMDGSGNAIAIWAQYDGIQRSAWVNHYNAAAGGWGVAKAIETLNNYVWYPEVAMNSSGTAIATWAQRDPYTSFQTRDNVWVNHYSNVPVTSYIPVFSLGGSVSSLTGAGLVLQNNGSDDLAIGGNGPFTFATPVYDGASYRVTVKTHPQGQFCTVANGSGALVGNNVTDVTNVSVSCEALPNHTVGGIATGFTSSGVVLQNNAGDDIIITGGSAFTFPTPMYNGETYSVSVKAHPVGMACFVNNGSGSITGSSITNVVVTCTPPYTINGSVSGLTGIGLLLQNNAGDDIVLAGNGGFTFPTTVADGSGYDVRVRVQPSGQLCQVSNGTGTITGADVTGVAVTCTDLAIGQYLVGGAVSGLTGTGLVLQNNKGDDITVNGDGSFIFPTPVASGGNYSVTIKSQPNGPRQTCSITASTGIVSSEHVSGIQVNCTTNSYTVTAKVSGLKGSGLVIRNNGSDYILASSNINYTFAIALPDGSPYAVSIKTQPAGQNCSVINASGTVSGVNVTNVKVSCRDNGLYSLGGTVTNLHSNDLNLTDLTNGSTTFVSSDGAFTLNKLLPAGTAYDVTAAIQPAGQTCTVTNGKGTVGTTDVTNISVNCVTNAGVTEYSIGGTVTGLKGAGLILQSNGGDDIAIAADGSFTFPRTRTDGSWYSVSVKQQPINLNQTCKVQFGGGQLAGANVTNVVVDCWANSYDIHGTISGLAGSWVTLDVPGWYGNHSFSADGSFSFAGIPDGTAFQVRVVNQPTGPNQTCTVINGASTFNGSDITNIEVRCVTNQYSISGSLQGMKGSGIVLTNNGVDDLNLLANGVFAFPQSLDDGTAFLVDVLAQPTGPSQTCLLGNNDSILAGANVTNVVVNCAPWTWMSGSNMTGDTGVYGVQGVADPANLPRSRDNASSWKDSNGNFWIFAGYNNPQTKTMNDLWKYDPLTGLWTWMKGSQNLGAGAVFNIQGTADPTNDPGSRDGAISWQGAGDTFWIFSGSMYNDLWKYDVASNNWTWISGTSMTLQKGIYVPTGPGGKTLPVPGYRRDAVSWTDASGNLWMFGGTGSDSLTTSSGRLNDLWKYDPVANLWTWVSGSDIMKQRGNYGTQGVAAATNVPGAREGAVSWTDASGNFWMFGGSGYDSAGTLGNLNDLWMYDLTTGNWTWVGGSKLANDAGSYGTIGNTTASNMPPARKGALLQKDSSGNVWLYGGTGSIMYADLWKYDTATGLWTWVAGSNVRVENAIYGTQGVAGALNIPGSRDNSVGWFDASDTLWIFGGYGWVSANNWNSLNDFWTISP